MFSFIATDLFQRRNNQDILVLLRLAYRLLSVRSEAQEEADDIAEEAVVAISAKSVAARDYICKSIHWRKLLLQRLTCGDEAAVMTVWNILQSTSSWPDSELSQLRAGLEKALPVEPCAAGGLAYIVEKDSPTVIQALLDLADGLAEQPDEAELLADIKAALLNVVSSPKDLPEVAFLADCK